MHVKAFAMMTRHPVRLEQLPPDLREGVPTDARGRIDRPPREFRAEIFSRFHAALEPLRARRQARRDPAAVPVLRRAQAGLVRVPGVGARAAAGGRGACRVPPPLLAGRRAPGGDARLSRGARDDPRRDGLSADRGGEEHGPDGMGGDDEDGLRPPPRPQRTDLERPRRRAPRSGSTTSTRRRSCASSRRRSERLPGTSSRPSSCSTTTDGAPTEVADGFRRPRRTPLSCRHCSHT